MNAETDLLYRYLKPGKFERLEDLIDEEVYRITPEELETLLIKGKDYLSPERYRFLQNIFSIPFAFINDRLDLIEIILKYGGEITCNLATINLFMDMHYQKIFGPYEDETTVFQYLPEGYSRERFYLVFLLYASYCEGPRNRTRRLEMVLRLYRACNFPMVTPDELEGILMDVSYPEDHETIQFVSKKLKNYFYKTYFSGPMSQEQLARLEERVLFDLNLSLQTE